MTFRVNICFWHPFTSIIYNLSWRLFHQTNHITHSSHLCLMMFQHFQCKEYLKTLWIINCNLYNIVAYCSCKCTYLYCKQTQPWCWLWAQSLRVDCKQKVLESVLSVKTGKDVFDVLVLGQYEFIEPLTPFIME